MPFLLDEALGGDGDAAGGTGLGARGKPAPALALLLHENGHEVGLQVGAAPGNPRFEPAHQVGRDSDLHLGRQVVDPAQEAIQHAELFFRQLRRAGVEGLGGLPGRYRWLPP